MYTDLFQKERKDIGIFGHNGAARFDQIADGLSQTIAVRETLQRPPGGERMAVVWGQGKLYGQMVQVDGSEASTVNLSTVNLSTAHRGGGNVLFADGAVRYLDQGMSAEVYRKLFTIREGDEDRDAL